MRTLLLLSLLSLAGCMGGRARKFLAPDAFVLPDGPTGAIAHVRYDEGTRKEPPRLWDAERVLHDGRSFVRPVTLTSSGWLELDPIAPGATVRVYQRHEGIVPSDFQRVVTVTGGLHGAIPNEIRPIPTTLENPWRLYVHQLENVYNAYEFQDGDLLLVELEAPDLPTEHYLFRSRRLGLRSKFGAGVLVRVPIALDTGASVSPAFAATVALGYRPRTSSGLITWAGDKIALVASLGVGSTAVEAVDGNVDEQLDTFLNAALGGGGIEFYDILSLQVLANLSALGRERSEDPATLAIGFDAVQFGRFTRDAGRRLFWKNRLDAE